MSKVLAERLRAMADEVDGRKPEERSSPPSDYDAFCRRAETRLNMEPNTLPASLTARQASVVLGWGYSSTKTAVRNRTIPTLPFGQVERRIPVPWLWRWLSGEKSPAEQEGGDE